MTLSDRQSGDVTIVDLSGRLVVQDGTDSFRDAIVSLISRGRLKLVLNLEAVPYIDSMGLGEIVRAYTRAIRQGGTLKLLHLNDRIRALFTMTMLLSVFEAFDAEADAVASFQSPR